MSDVDVLPTESSVFKLEKPVTLITGISPNDAVTVGSGLDQQVWVCAGEPLDGEDCATTPKDYVINVFNTRLDEEVDTKPGPPLGVIDPIDIKVETGGPYCTPTSMAVAESSTFKKIFVTAFDSGKILVYDANTFTLVGPPISVGPGPRRIVIQPEIVE